MLGVGTTFAGYQLEGVLGQGGMGTVYLAKHPRLPRSVALKLLNKAVSDDPELTRRFELEADVVARLDHPGIVGVFDRGADEGHLWIAMQYVRGTDAGSWNAGMHPASTAARLIGDTAGALDYAHGQGVLHRDVKPANILIADADAGRESHAVLTDFGIARLTEANTTLTATGTFTATIAFGSPEQLSGEVVDARSDQYSLACTLFAILAGRSPYASTNSGQVVMGHISQPVPRLTDIRKDLPPSVDAVLGRAMAKRRDERFGSCTEFATAMRDALEGRHVAVPVHPSSPTIRQAGPIGPAGGASVSGPPAAWAPHGGVPMPGSGARFAVPGYGPAPSNPAYGPKPSMKTVLTAGIITQLFGLLFAGIFILGVTDTVKAIGEGNDKLVQQNIPLLGVVVAVALLWNSAGLLLLTGRPSGRILTIICSVLATLLCLIACVAIGVTGEWLALIAYVPLLVIVGTALVCATSPSTKRWIAYRVALRGAHRWG
ncbi:serine/threonine protein kinase [Nocardia cyriacigeorgica]|uniref:serine/threonine protein kinase n=1 Tax=Nocardia cyriacigeorgica TaxID=135487 RepID=UPI0018936FF1|nr:serine/threonine-protein kinase [Nocardia cyriacigeorgica]MBF6456719.1 serine/threonine protein kinase [Nocardia cyriacigeorgica]MBF6476644.1 serine/threonine protein kinase [Nocardia cyriacigeorgica]MBF6551524.1 serine/threonine protein kinase [Nocardia cyriacigeorgica]